MRARVIAAGGVLCSLLVAGGVVGLVTSRGSPALAGTTAKPARSAAAPRSLSGVFGLNEGVTIPEKLIDMGLIPDEGAHLARNAGHAVAAGTAVVRGNSANYPFFSQLGHDRKDPDYHRADLYFKALGDAGLDTVVVLGPWPGTSTASYTNSYVPSDMASYLAFVRATVERYDGDGKDDMPGLTRPAIAWEVDNEPDLHNSVPPLRGKAKVDPKNFERPNEYATVLVATAKAIREADKDAVILGGSLYRGGAEAGRNYLAGVLAEPGAREAFDVLSLHCYFDEQGTVPIDACLETWRTLTPEKPLWITETGTPSDGRKPWATEDWQGRALAMAYGAFLAGGAERVFWHTLSDPPPGAMGANASPFASHSLYRTAPNPNGGPLSPNGERTLKPAGLVYQRLATALKGADPANLRAVEARGGHLMAAGTGWLAWEGTPKAPEGAGHSMDLLTGQTVAIKAGQAVAAPAWISP